MELEVLAKLFQVLDLPFEQWTVTTTGTLQVVLKALKMEKKRFEDKIEAEENDLG